MDIKTIKDKLAKLTAAFKIGRHLIRKTFDTVNEKVDIAFLQRKYRADRKKVLMLNIRDVNYQRAFRIENGEVRTVDNPRNIDGYVEMDYQTVMDIFRGKTKMTDPATGRPYYEPYTFEDAWRYNDIVAKGEGGITNETLLFIRVLPHVIPIVREELSDVLELVDMFD